jgi:N-acetyl-alpha-D-muramate 1-phosphate uridylyltransferase
VSLGIAILAGGLATRMRPFTDSVPKVLLEVAGRPFAEHQIELLRENGVRDVVFCVGHLGDQVESAIGDGSRWGMRIGYAFDGPTLLGTGGAVRKAFPLLGEECLVLYGDAYLDCDYQAVASAFRRSGRAGLMTVFLNEDRWDRSNVIYDGGEITVYDKHRRTEGMRYIDYGLGALSARAFEPYPADEPLDLATVYQDLLARGELAACEVHQRFFEIGSPEGLAETSDYISSRRTPAAGRVIHHLQQ